MALGRIPDLGLLTSTTVTVLRQVDGGQADPFGAPIETTETEQVSGVLAKPGATANLDPERPDGTRVDMTFHFPWGYAKSLRGCSIQYGGATYRVIGDPQPSDPAITPGPFGMKVETEAVDG